MKDKKYLWILAGVVVLYILWDQNFFMSSATLTNKAAGNAPGQFGG